MKFHPESLYRKGIVLRIATILLIIIFYLNSLLWLFSSYTGSLFNALHLFFFLGSAIYFYNSRSSTDIKKEGSPQWISAVFIISFGIFSLINELTVNISIISVIFFYLSLGAYVYEYFFHHNFRSALKFGTLLLFSLPIAYYVNAIVGPIIREFYAQMITISLHLNNPDIVKNGTAIILGNKYVLVDSGCSGVRNMLIIGYFLVTFGIFKQLKFEKIVSLLRNLVVIFSLLNTIHLVVVSHLFLVARVTDIVPGHVFLGFTVSLLSMIMTLILYYRKDEKI